MIRFLILALALLTCACNTGHKTVAVRNASLSEPAQAAIDAWNEKLALQCPGVSLTMVDDYESADIRIGWGDVGPINEVALAIERDQDIIMNASQFAKQESEGRYYSKQAVITHELGHAMGAHHSSDKRDVMFEATPKGDPKPLTVHDIYSVCRLYDGVP